MLPAPSPHPLQGQLQGRQVSFPVCSEWSAWHRPAGCRPERTEGACPGGVTAYVVQRWRRDQRANQRTVPGWGHPQGERRGQSRCLGRILSVEGADEGQTCSPGPLPDVTQRQLVPPCRADLWVPPQDTRRPSSSATASNTHTQGLIHTSPGRPEPGRCPGLPVDPPLPRCLTHLPVSPLVGERSLLGFSVYNLGSRRAPVPGLGAVCAQGLENGMEEEPCKGGGGHRQLKAGPGKAALCFPHIP